MRIFLWIAEDCSANFLISTSRTDSKKLELKSHDVGFEKVAKPFTILSEIHHYVLLQNILRAMHNLLCKTTIFSMQVWDMQTYQIFNLWGIYLPSP